MRWNTPEYQGPSDTLRLRVGPECHQSEGEGKGEGAGVDEL